MYKSASQKSVFNSKYFIPDLKNTNKYYKNSKVQSCRKIIEKRGVLLAENFKIINNKGNRLNAYKFFRKYEPKNYETSYNKDYTKKILVHAGMGMNKPLVPYSPDDYRNRLLNNILPPIKKLNKSASYDIIGDKNINYKWCSIYQKLFRKPQIIPINNSAILSEIPKFIHKNVYN